MSVEVISSGQVTAKKRHRCTWCGEWIAVGEVYQKEFVKVDGDAGHNKLHPECYEDLLECAHNEGGSCTYTLYGQERPKHQSEE